MENNDQNTDSLKVKSTKLGDICILLKQPVGKIIL